MVPPWVPDAPTDDAANQDQDQPPSDQGQGPIAPVGRFFGTRLNLGRFASSGNRDDLRRGVGHYIKTGYGGSGTATKRFGGTARSAARLFGALSPAAPGERNAERDALEAAAQDGRSTADLVTALVEVVRPVDGTQDAEASRRSINDAFAELLQRHPDADLLALTAEQRELVIERFIAFDVYHRFCLDVAASIREKAPTPSVALARLREVKDYIREHIADAFRRLRERGQRLVSGRVATFVSQALRDAFDVFQAYAE